MHIEYAEDHAALAPLASAHELERAHHALPLVRVRVRVS